MAVVIETTMGRLTVDLFIKERPITCNNFLKLCKMKYYNFSLFHSVQNNFIAQTGDPTGTGNGGESVFGMIHGENAKYYEAEAMPKIKHSRAGLVSMVNCGNNMLGSQFFFTLGEDLHSLDGEHCVFGEVSDGLEVLIQLNEVICDEEHHPFRDIRITHTVILEDPFDDPPNLIFPDHSPKPTKERLMNGLIAPDEEVDDTKGKSLEEVEEMVQKREAQARATILEIVGDIPDADIAPPENILFVCKLNPVTTDEDLEIIFGRFGTIKSCEVIRDKTTGDSLQYAFIEFEDKKACENAYFKMDNVLIDDRRIHVDFSQSVAKMRWRGKGKGVDYFPDAKPKDSQQRVSKDGDGKFDQKDRKRRRSRSPGHLKWWNQDERNSESWEKYQERKDKDRESFGRSYKKVRDSNDGRGWNYEDKVKDEFRGQRIHERNRGGRYWNNGYGYKWENRIRHDGREHRHHSRSHGSERQADAETWNGRDRRNHNYEKNERRNGVMEERRRSSKESSSKSDKRSEDAERLSVRNDKMTKDDSDGKNTHGETSKYDEGKSESMRLSLQRKDQEKYKHDFENHKYGPDMSSENEERMASHNKKERYEEDKDRMVSTDSGRRGNHSSRSNEYRSHHYEKSASDDQTSSRISGRDDVNIDRAVEQMNNVDVIDSDGSAKYESSQSLKHGSEDGQDVSTLKRTSDKKASKHTSGDGSRRSWSSEKIKKGHGSKSRKMMQKRKRYSSSSSCCSNSSCSGGSSCCSSSSGNDDSDYDSNSELSESYSSSSTSPKRKIKMKKRSNKKKLLLEIKKNRGRRTGHKKRQRSSSESSAISLDEVTKAKCKHRRRKMDDSSSSEQKVRSTSHSGGRKIKKRRKKSQKRKNESLDSSSEESSSSSESYVQRKSFGTKNKKKFKKGVKKIKNKINNVKKHKGKKFISPISSKKKRKRNEFFK